MPKKYYQTILTMKKLLCCLLALVLAFALCSCADTNKPRRFSSTFFDLFDTVSTVTAYDMNKKIFDTNLDQLHQRLEEYHKLYDIYNSYEGLVNINTLNYEAGKAPVTVDEKIIDLLEFGKEVYELSGGKTNICFGAVLSIWHQYRAQAENAPEAARLPDMAELEAAAEHTDINDLVIDRESSTVFFADPQLKLDVGAIAKGYAVSEVCKWAQENLWSSAIVNIGGNVCTFGYKNADGATLWNIGIENPEQNADGYLETVTLTDLSVVTSGDYQRYYTVDGKRYCHIIDPDTLMPAEYVSAVSVICEDSALGDALSTSLFNMPIEQGMKLVEDMQGVEAIWTDKGYNTYYSSAFESYIIN